MIAQILRQVHRDYYHAYDGRADKAPDARVPLGCDVEVSRANVPKDCI